METKSVAVESTPQGGGIASWPAAIKNYFEELKIKDFFIRLADRFKDFEMFFLFLKKKISLNIFLLKTLLLFFKPKRILLWKEHWKIHFGKVCSDEKQSKLNSVIFCSFSSYF